MSTTSQNENPLHEMISKRLRAHRKKLTKIEKYQSLDPSTLNKDQIETISRKSEVLASIKELEDIQKQLVLFEQDLSREKQLAKEQHDQLLNQKVEEAIANTLTLSTQVTRHMQTIQFALLKPITKLIGAHTITEQEFNALLYLKNVLNNPTSTVDDYIEKAEQIYKGLYDQSEDLVPTTTITCKHANQLIFKLLEPVQEVSFGLFGVKDVPVPEITMRPVPLEQISFLTMDTAPTAEPDALDEKVEHKVKKDVDGKKKFKNKPKARESVVV